MQVWWAWPVDTADDCSLSGPIHYCMCTYIHHVSNTKCKYILQCISHLFPLILLSLCVLALEDCLLLAYLSYTLITN